VDVTLRKDDVPGQMYRLEIILTGRLVQVEQPLPVLDLPLIIHLEMVKVRVYFIFILQN
jgi:hypothetical protein